MSRRVLALIASVGLLGGLLAISAGPVLAATCTTTCYVNVNTGSDATGDGSPGNPFKTINMGLTTVAVGGTVVVAAGVYPEFVDITKSVTLQGANSGVSCLGARSTESVVTGTTAGAFKIDADNVTINGFQVSDALNVGPIGTNAGIWMNAGNAGANITNNLVTNNIIGIYANSDGASSISCNIFDGNLEPGVGVTGAHIYAEFTEGLTIDRNIFRNQTGVNANNPVLFGATAAGVHHNLTFSNNTLTNTDFGLLLIGVDTGSFTGNDINTNGATGITLDGANTHITITGNLIHNNARGVRVRDAGYGLGANSDIHINRNSLTGNTEADGVPPGPNYGIGNVGGYGGLILDGECNWWGAASGPGPVGPGSGDMVTTNVDFTPWLLTSDLAGACQRLQVTKTPSVTNLPSGGGSVTYTFVVTNAGITPLTNVVLSDSTCSPATLQVGGDANTNSILETTETWTYVCTRTVTSTTTNTVTVTAHMGNTTLTATAQATVTVAAPPVTPPPVTTPSPASGPRIAIAKAASPTSLPLGGGSVTYTYKVTNTGGVALTSVTVTDNTCSPLTLAAGGDANANSALDLTETWTYTCTKAVTATTTNTAVASGTGLGTVVTASAQATVTVATAPTATPTRTPTVTPQATVAGTTRPRVTLPPTDQIAPVDSSGGSGMPFILLVLVGIAALAVIPARARWSRIRR